MRCLKTIRAVLFAAAAFSAAAEASAKGECRKNAGRVPMDRGQVYPLRFSISNDHTNLLYAVGEEATFTVAVRTSDGQVPTGGTVVATLDNYGPKRIGTETFDLAKGSVLKISGRLQEPGFLRLCLAAPKTWSVWSVGYEPEKLEKGSPRPADFDAFWATARAKLAKEVPLDAQVVRVDERSTADFDYYRISFATFGRRVHGYMSVPTDRSRAPFPVDVQVAAAGFGNWTNDMGGRKDSINVFFSVYPFEPHWKWASTGLQKAYDALNAVPGVRDEAAYSVSGLAKGREAYFYYPVILGIDRAVDWIAGRPDVDLRRFRYQGTSQGGGFGFYLTALNRHFTRAAFFVPAITDTMGFLKGRQSGWPQPIEKMPNDADREAAKAVAPYFDAANFASLIRCPVRVVVGFSDPLCAPCAVYSAYNAIPAADKAIIHGFGMTHSCRPEFYAALDRWIREPER